MAKTKTNWKVIIIALIIASFILSYSGGLKSFNLFEPKDVKVSKAVDFINKNLLQDATATAEEITEESGVYKFTLKIGEEGYDTYLTKDGRILFPQGINIAAIQEEIGTSGKGVQKKTCEELAKKETPILEAFVVSQCPFGLQMQRVLNEIVKNIPQLAPYIKVEYMGEVVEDKISSMHDNTPGGAEATENLRQICLREEQTDKYWSYIDCYLKEGKTDECLVSSKVDVSKLTSCMNDVSKGIAYAQKDFEREEKFKVEGSPALILNEEEVSEFDFGGRTAEAVKTVLCCGFENQPDFCQTKLTTEQAATSFSSEYAVSGSSSNASCN